MITVDYSNYLDQQSEWAKSLCQVAKTLDTEPACEMGEISADALRRLIHFSVVARRVRTFVP